MDDLTTEIIKSGNKEAFDQMMNQYRILFELEQERKLLLEKNNLLLEERKKLLEKNKPEKIWEKWDDYKKKLAKEIELFQHPIRFKTVIYEAGLVKGEDYTKRVLIHDKFPSILVSIEGAKKIYNCYSNY